MTLYRMENGMVEHRGGLGKLDDGTEDHALCCSWEKADDGTVWAHIVRMKMERVPADQFISFRYPDDEGDEWKR